MDYKKVLREVINAVLPPACPMCGKPAPFAGGSRVDICPDCMRKVSYVSEPVCLKCGKPVEMMKWNIAVIAAGKNMFMTRHALCMNILSASRIQYTDSSITIKGNMQVSMQNRLQTSVAA